VHDLRDLLFQSLILAGSSVWAVLACSYAAVEKVNPALNDPLWGGLIGMPRITGGPADALDTCAAEFWAEGGRLSEGLPCFPHRCGRLRTARADLGGRLEPAAVGRSPSGSGSSCRTARALP
jgi:hypothetical protein